jgi:hypothetical protein
MIFRGNRTSVFRIMLYYQISAAAEELPQMGASGVAGGVF